jgi:hypothetical protein
MRTQGAFRITEVLPYLRLSCLLHVCVISIDAAAGLVEFDDGYGFVCACPMTAESANHVAVQSLGAKDYEYVDYQM